MRKVGARWRKKVCSHLRHLSLERGFNMKDRMMKIIMMALCLVFLLGFVTMAAANDGVWLSARITVDTPDDDLIVIEAAPVPMSEYFSIEISDEPVFVNEIELDADLQRHLQYLARFGDFEAANYVLSIFAAQEANTK